MGWSKNDLGKPHLWYHEFNVNNQLEPRCVFGDDITIWYTTISPHFKAPEDGILNNIEDLVEVLVKENEKDGPITGPACKAI